MHLKIVQLFIGVTSIFYGEYDVTSSYKRIHRLIALEETKGFMNDNALGK